MLEYLSQPWPWYIAGPLIGLMVPLLLLFSGKAFGISSSLRHMCAATLPKDISYFRYDWKKRGLWNLTFALGVLLGGLIAGTVLLNPEPVAISEATTAELTALGITNLSGLVPEELISWSNLATPAGLITLVLGGFLLGFGARYAGGCTSGHGITGLATFQVKSLIAVMGFFIGGLFVTHLVFPFIF